MWNSAIVRALRVAVAAAAGAGVSSLLATPWGLAAAPFLAGLGKYLRAKHPKTYDWLPI